jgi:coenzyme F420 hydrogenase subunit beta
VRFVRVDEVVHCKLCMGCGACIAICRREAITLVDVPDAGLRPVINDSNCNQCGLCVKVCPGIALESPGAGDMSSEPFSQEWGNVFEIWEGYAVDKEIRFNGASGGVVTALGLYTIENGKSDAVLHICADPHNPLSNIVVLSRCRTELMRGTGSRYSPTAPCSYIRKTGKDTGIITFVGKPCDTAGLFKIAAVEQGIRERIGLKISIFCAGSPTTKGTYVLLNKMNVNPLDVGQIRYRGCGWPGMTTVKMRDGLTKQITYEAAWGGVLSDYGQFRCAVCPDSAGEFSDIACADGWHRKADGGNPGWSLMIVRTEKGRRVLHDAMDAGYITGSRVERNTLNSAQPSLLRKQRELWGRLRLMRLFGMATPDFKGFHLHENWRRLGIRAKIKCNYVAAKDITRQYLMNHKKVAQ